MKIVIAPDSFKECLSAQDAASAIAAGVYRACPNANCILVPMADGGEGTVDALVATTSGTLVHAEVTGPMGERVTAAYGLTGDGSTAVIEMAIASGLELVPESQRDPRVATTRGTGELMVNALEQGVQHIILGIGGSATNDAGAGMAQALGFSLQDAQGNELAPGGAALSELTTIDASSAHPGLSACEVLVACDVTNPLCGPQGASHIYGPQKGATPAMVNQLDDALHHFADVVKIQRNVDVLELPGSGAAGGLGAGLVAFADAQLARGVDLIAEAAGLAAHMHNADLVITGEGAMDHQTVHGKTPAGVAALAYEQDIPVIALAGRLGEGYQALYGHGLTAAFSICAGPISLAEALENAPQLLTDAAESAMRFFSSCAHRS